MRGNPVIQSLLIVLVFSLLGLAGAHFIAEGTHVHGGDAQMHASDDDDNTHEHGIAVELECYFSDTPTSYTLRRPDADKDLIFKASGSEQSPVYHDIILRDKSDNVFWLDVAWEREKTNGQYFAQIILSVGDQEPREFLFRTHTNTLNGTIQLDLSSTQHPHEH